MAKQEASDLERELEILEAELKRLEAEYNMYFAGRLPRPPWETRGRVNAMVRRLDNVHIGRDEIRVWRGLRPFPRRYARTDQSRILQIDNFVFLGTANEFSLTNATLAPTLHSPFEARWIAWEMRRAMEETR